MQEQVSSSLQQMTEIAAPGNTPSLDEVRDKIERRYSTALGQAELAQNSVQGRMLEIEEATLDAAGASRLEQIRASLGSGSGGSGGSGQQQVTGGEHRQVTSGGEGSGSTSDGQSQASQSNQTHQQDPQPGQA